MRKLVILLAITSLGFAASTVYLARELQTARGAPTRESTASPASPLDAHPTSNPLTAGMASPLDSKPATQTDSLPPPADMKTMARKWLVSQIPTMRAMLEDPQKRAAAMRDFRNNLRKAYPGLAEHLGLTGDEYTRLDDLLVDQQFRELDARYQCALKPGCDYLALGTDMQSIKDRELADLLGAEETQQFKTYQDDMQERGPVTYLRGQLTDAMPMSNTQAEKLIAALGDERRRVIEEMEQRGANGQVQFNTTGNLVISSTAVGVEQKLAEAADFQRRQRERAAQVLTAAQLKEFTRIQEDLLDGMRQGLEYEEEVKAANPK